MGDRIRVSPYVRDMFEGPCALVVGGHDADGAPVATWAWGVAFSDDSTSARLVVQHERGFTPGGSLAFTAGDLFTTRSVQVKGSIVTVVEPTPEDLYRASRHIEGFRLALEKIDGVAREKTEELQSVNRDGFRTHVVDIEAVFDQSPGPDAGSVLRG